MASFRNIYTSLMLVIAGSTSKELAREVCVPSLLTIPVSFSIYFSSRATGMTFPRALYFGRSESSNVIPTVPLKPYRVANFE